MLCPAAANPIGGAVHGVLDHPLDVRAGQRECGLARAALLLLTDCLCGRIALLSVGAARVPAATATIVRAVVDRVVVVVGEQRHVVVVVVVVFVAALVVIA